MLQQLRACLWLLLFTVLMCSVIYPLSLWVVGQTIFPHQANGSLIDKHGRPVFGEDGKPVGSWLIAQEFKGDEYFQARPSAVSYNGATSGASNYGANNYLLRDRVARALAPLVKYDGGSRDDKPVAPFIVKWFREDNPRLVAEWASAHSGLAQAWVKSDDVAAKYVEECFAAADKTKRVAVLAKWKEENPKVPEPKTDDLAVPFFTSFAEEHPGTWLAINIRKDAKGDSIKDDKGEPLKQVDLIRPTDEDSGDIAAVFFDMWRQAHPDVALRSVPADLVMASASGLDPHITLKNALYQLDRVAAKWEKSGLSALQVRDAIETLLRQKASAPLFGLAGVEMVNVLDLNLALTNELKLQRKAKR
jgi:K+-transporting ATPase ATPase C chain